VLIPARNEAENIGRSLEAVLSQNYPDFEVLVMDDRSEDDTARIAADLARRDPRLRLLRNAGIPEGWTGKNTVLWKLSREARGDILLFLDADVTLDPGAISVMTSCFVEKRLDMLSAVLRIESRSFWEKAVRLFVGAMLMLRFPLKSVNNPKSGTAFGNGQAIMMRAETYRAVGGHERVKSIVMEDMALARLVKQHGLRLFVAYGFDLAATRMYSSLGEILRGWSRIFFGAFRGSVGRLLLCVLMTVVFSLSPFVALFYAVTLLALGASASGPLVALLVLSIVQVLSMKTLMVRVSRMTRSEPLYVAFYLPAALFSIGILFSAISRRFSSKGIVWKGVRYDVRGDSHAM
jgi:chlorobactene glucosyltransferase